MHDINWWLMAVAFVLGLALTLFLTIGRLNEDVPEDGTPADEQ